LSTEDFYKILGVGKEAKKEEIKKAYRKLARELHPDRNNNNKEAEEKFKKVSAAYAVLGDEEKRKKYDTYGIDGLRDGFDQQMWKQYGENNSRGRGEYRGGGFGGFDFGGFEGFGAMEDIFESLFGTQRRRKESYAEKEYWKKTKQKGTKVKSKLEVELMDAVIGRELQLIVPIEGEKKKLKIKIPQGIESGKTMRLKGQGAKSKNGGPPGDLLLEIIVKKDKIYERIGEDLYKREVIKIGEAYNGTVKDVNTPWGEVKVTIPKGTQGGSKLRLRGKGIKKENKNGDLYINVAIAIPKKSAKEAKEAIEILEKYY
jgi:curved DNA-binding protein